jgi:uncharacterized membrane protein YagU involved in acid resistance
MCKTCADGWENDLKYVQAECYSLYCQTCDGHTYICHGLFSFAFIAVHSMIINKVVGIKTKEQLIYGEEKKILKKISN